MADFESHWIDNFNDAEEWLDHCEEKYAKREAREADWEEEWQREEGRADLLQWLELIDAPLCPKLDCGERMMPRLANQGFNAGNHFWGCQNFPHCRGTRVISQQDRARIRKHSNILGR